ncbi:MAG: NADH-quinone oxidoreductase subunit J family protein, partial [Chloroflexota bacterium]
MSALFWPIVAACIVAVFSAIGVVVVQGAIRAVVALLAHSLAIAALYALLSASLVAVGQVLIYSGAIVVLFLFVVTLLPPGGTEIIPEFRRLAAGIGVGAVLLAALFAAMAGGTVPAVSRAAVGNVAGVGHQLFDPGKLVVPFELTAPLLLVAICGAVALWRRQEQRI